MRTDGLDQNSNARRDGGFTLLELTISLVLVSVLLAILLPALSSARIGSARDHCASNLRRCGHAWHAYLEDHDGQFPYVPVQPAWRYAGVRFSSVDDRPILDPQRPLNPYLPFGAGGAAKEGLLHCPADDGITGATDGVGTGRRTAFRSFGTSYRATADLLDARPAGPVAPSAEPPRGLRRAEISTVASRLVLMGDPIWYEVHEDTGRDAAWHGDADRGNLLFLDGSVKYMRLFTRPQVGPAVFEPRLVAR